MPQKRMRYSTFLLWMVMCFGAIVTSSVSAQQNTIDSLNQLVKLSSNDSIYIANMGKLIREYQTIDPKLAVTKANKLLDFAKQQKNDYAFAVAYYHLAVANLFKGQYDSLRHFAELSLQRANNKKVAISIAAALNLKAVYFWNVGKPDSSIKYHLQALRIRERIRDLEGIGTSYLGMGSLYVSVNKLNDAINILEKAIDLGKKTNNNKMLYNSMHMLANVYATQKQYQKALQIDFDALKILRNSQDKRGLSQIYSNMANCYAALNQFQKAISYHLKTLEIDRFFKDDRQIADTYYNLASVYDKMGNNELAVKYGINAVDLFKKTNYKEGLVYTYKLLSSSYAKTSNYAAAFEAEKWHNTYQREIFSAASDRNIEDLKTQYQTEKKEQQIRTLHQKNVIQDLQIKQKNTLLAAAITVIMLALLTGYFLYSRRKLRAAAELQQEINKQQSLAASAVIEAEERERRRIANELHDGVGQMLSAALLNLNGFFKHLNLTATENAKAAQSLALVNESYDEMRSISHQMMPNALIKMGLSPAINEFIGKLNSDKLKVSLETVGLERRLDMQMETVLYRIIQETVNNVIKHAKATRLTLQLVKDVEGITASIEDNGIGFDKTKVAMNEGIGLENIYSRVAYLKGDVDIDTAPGKGTSISIFIPNRSSL